MSYKITKDGRSIAHAEQVIVLTSGALQTYDQPGGRVDAIFAPGHWDVAFYVEEGE